MTDVSRGKFPALTIYVLKGSSRVPAPRTSAEPKDKILSHCLQESAGDQMQIIEDNNNNNNFITRDDVVSQRLKFGSAFLSYSWESKIALLF